MTRPATVENALIEFLSLKSRVVFWMCWTWEVISHDAWIRLVFYHYTVNSYARLMMIAPPVYCVIWYWLDLFVFLCMMLISHCSRISSLLWEFRAIPIGLVNEPNDILSVRCRPQCWYLAKAQAFMDYLFTVWNDYINTMAHWYIMDRLCKGKYASPCGRIFGWNDLFQFASLANLIRKNWGHVF